MTTLNMFRHVADGQTFAAGQIIFEEGQAGEVMYVVQAGNVDIIHDEQVIDSAAPGDFIGEMALIDQRTRSATAIARTDCTLVAIDAKRFMYLVQETPYFALTVMRVVVERLRRRLDQGGG